MCVLCPRFVSSLTVTLDQLSVNLSLSLNTSQSQVVQPNLAVQSAQIPAVDTQGVQFTALSGQCKEIQPDWSCLEPITLHDHINLTGVKYCIFIAVILSWFNPSRTVARILEPMR